MLRSAPMYTRAIICVFFLIHSMDSCKYLALTCRNTRSRIRPAHTPGGDRDLVGMDRGHPPLTACGGRASITVITYARCDRLQDYEKGTAEALRPSPP